MIEIRNILNPENQSHFNSIQSEIFLKFVKLSSNSESHSICHTFRIRNRLSAHKNAYQNDLDEWKFNRNDWKLLGKNFRIGSSTIICEFVAFAEVSLRNPKYYAALMMLMRSTIVQLIIFPAAARETIFSRPCCAQFAKSKLINEKMFRLASQRNFS